MCAMASELGDLRAVRSSLINLLRRIRYLRRKGHFGAELTAFLSQERRGRDGRCTECGWGWAVFEFWGMRSNNSSHRRPARARVASRLVLNQLCYSRPAEPILHPVVICDFLSDDLGYSISRTALGGVAYRHDLRNCKILKWPKTFASILPMTMTSRPRWSFEPNSPRYMRTFICLSMRVSSFPHSSMNGPNRPHQVDAKARQVAGNQCVNKIKNNWKLTSSFYPHSPA